MCEYGENAESCLPQSAECLVVSSREPACLPANLPAAAGSGWQAAVRPAAAPRGLAQILHQLDNEQGDKVELWRSYHPEPPGHAALLVVTGTFIIGKTHSKTRTVCSSRPFYDERGIGEIHRFLL